MIKRIQALILGAYSRFEHAKGHLPELIVLCAYVLSLAVFMYYHEPWYDEAQAWLIARDGSWHDIFFLIPHYEGHPPVWYLILAVFAKNGADFDLTIKCLTLSINAAAMYLLIYRSPFSRLIRCILPFTYFLFYQHGVICRPYSMLLIGFLLAAHFWQVRNQKPFCMAFSLMLMCASSAYGIIFAGGITLAWLWELRDGKNLKGFLLEVLSGKRLWAYVSLLVFALLNIAAIIPKPDTFAASYGLSGNNPVWLRLIYMYFGSIADATCFSSYEDYNELRYVWFSIPKLIIGCLIGFAILLLIYHFGKKCKTVSLFVVPFVLFATFSGVVYFYLQHIDVLLQFLLFWAWVSQKEYRPDSDQAQASNRIIRYATPIMLCGVGLSLAVSAWWNVAACINEVRYQYGFSQQLAAFLDNYGLTEYGIMVRWQQLTDENGKVIYNNTNQTVNGVALNAYYDENIVINMNGGDPDMTYVTHRIPTEEENERVLQSWKEAGLPALTLDRCQLKSLFPEYRDVYIQCYTDVLFLPEYHIWKNGYTYSKHHLYVRNDIARKHFFSE